MTIKIKKALKVYLHLNARERLFFLNEVTKMAQMPNAVRNDYENFLRSSLDKLGDEKQ